MGTHLGPVRLTDFAQFCSVAGTARVSLVRDLAKEGDYDAAEDFYRPLRAAIRDMHAKGLDFSHLDKMFERLSDAKKITNYPRNIEGYKRFLRANTVNAWFIPDRARVAIGTLDIDVNPEIGLTLGGRPHMIKLYLRKSALTKVQREVMLHVMRRAWQTDPSIGMGVLDVGTAKFWRADRLPAAIDPLVESEAAGFSALWSALRHT